MNVFRSLHVLVALSALVVAGHSFVLIPEELVSLLNTFYSRVPPIRLGVSNSKVGLGFRMGRNVDVQFQFELGPQDGSSTTQSPKRDTKSVQGPMWKPRELFERIQRGRTTSTTTTEPNDDENEIDSIR